MSSYNTPAEIDATAAALAGTPALTPEQLLSEQLLGPERVVSIEIEPAVLPQMLHLLPAHARPVDLVATDHDTQLLLVRLRGWNWPTDKAKILVADDRLMRVATLVPVF